jgi:hypothetical protein
MSTLGVNEYRLTTTGELSCLDLLLFFAIGAFAWLLASCVSGFTSGFTG